MNFIVYFFVALVVALSVLFGLDFASAPMSPMPASKHELRAAAPPPPAPTVVKVEPRPEAPVAAPEVAVKAPPAATAAPAATAGSLPPTALDQSPASIVAAEPGTVAAAPPPVTPVTPAAPSCNIAACAAAYRSFTAEDCTYQPLDGPRRLCTKGAPPAAATAASPATAAPEARAQACNIAACSQSYPRSFSAADCTFQPADGPRRACTK